MASFAPISDPEIRASALRFWLAVCQRAYSDDAEQRDDLAREAMLALLDLQRKATARGLPWKKVTEALAGFLLQGFEVYGLGFEAGYAGARHGPQ
jgi:hypothetical protein